MDKIARAEGLRVIEGKLDDDISGFFARNERLIGVNHLHHHHRKRFTIAHELGHAILHEGPYHLDNLVFRRDLKDGEDASIDEVEANVFAAEILMPRSLLEPEVTALPNLTEEAIEHLANAFDVSVQAMTIRLSHLGYLNEW